jgi:hypothetical protein
MKTLITWPKIRTFEQLITSLTLNKQFIGRDHDNKAMYDTDIPLNLPSLSIEATEKVHGTNAAFCFNQHDGFWAQARTRIISPEDDNLNSATWIYSHSEHFKSLVLKLAKTYDINLNTHTISIFFEFAGGKLGKKSCVPGCDHMAFIFQYFIVSDLDGSNKNFLYYPSSFEISAANIFTSPNLETIKLSATVISSGNYSDILDSIALDIEANSLISKAFNVENGIGEGFVASFFYLGQLHLFKQKGSKHCKRSERKPSIIDLYSDTQNTAIQLFIDSKALTPSRLSQAFEESPAPVKKQNLGSFLKWIQLDILEEEKDALYTLAEIYDIQWTQLSKIITSEAKKWFFQEIDNNTNIN